MRPKPLRGGRLAATILSLTLFGGIFGLGVGPAAAASCPADELCAGAVIDANNLDQVKDKTFDGLRLGDLLLEKLEWQIRDHGLRLTLREAKDFPVDQRHIAATAKYSGKVTLDPATRMPKGWVAGVPFPDLSPNDPDAGIKLAWNQAYGEPHGDSLDRPHLVWILIDGEKGLERIQTWSFKRIWMAGRYGTNQVPTSGDGSIHYKSIFIAAAPQDIKGIGSFSIRYTTGQVDDSWAYLRDQRRVRRLSGGAWRDPLGSTDYLNDDFDVLGGFPTWYSSYKLLGKKKILIMALGNGARRWVDGPENPADRFPSVDFANAPHWNPIDSYQVREVYALDVTMPDEHPYGRRVAYIDSQTFATYFGEVYDRKGDFMKWNYESYPMNQAADGSGQYVVWSNFGGILDFQRMHGSLFIGEDFTRFNSGVKEEEVSLSVLEAQGK